MSSGVSTAIVMAVDSPLRLAACELVHKEYITIQVSLEGLKQDVDFNADLWAMRYTPPVEQDTGEVND